MRITAQGPRSPHIYPFIQPFHDTPYDEERHKFDVRRRAEEVKKTWPGWMDTGLPGTGYGIGIHRTHPLSHLKSNFVQDVENLPLVYAKMMQGVYHRNGKRFYSRAKKAPEPAQHPYLTGEPCPVYGWKVTDRTGIRRFEAPHIEDRFRYKPYVALQEKKLMVDDDGDISPPKEIKKPATPKKEEKKSLRKRLFFWQ
jgi:hypothetical protein